MAEKKVSVRLVAEGGQQVRAILNGIGDAGKKGMQGISREVDLASARLAAFARSAKLAGAAAAAAVAAAGVMMVRSSLETVDAQAKLARSFDTTVESIQALTWAGDMVGVSMSEIEQGAKQLTARLSEAAAGSGTAVEALQRLQLSARDLQAMPLDQRLIAINDALARFVPEGQRAAVAADLFGAKAALAITQMDGDTIRQATKDVRDFGVGLSQVEAKSIEDAGDALAKIGLIGLGVANRLTAAVAPALIAVADGMTALFARTGPLGSALTMLFENLGRLAAYAGTFAAFMAGRWVASMAMAVLSLKGLATGMVLLRGAIIRTGIGALIVGAGELVYWFTRLVEGAGGFGEAMVLLGDLVSEVWDRMKIAGAGWMAAAIGHWESLKAAALEWAQGSIESLTGWANAALGIFQGAFDAVKAIWATLPEAIGDFAFQAASALVGGVESMINAVVTRINAFIGGLNSALDLLPDWAKGEGGLTIGTLSPVELGRPDNPYAGGASRAGGAAAAAFEAAQGQTYVDAPDLGLTGMAERARASADTWARTAGVVAEAASRPLESAKALWAAITNAGEDDSAALDDAGESAGNLNDALDETAGKAGGAGKAGKEAGEETATGWDAAVKSVEEYAKSAADVGAQVGNGLVGAFNSAEQALTDFVKNGKLDFREFASSIIADMAKIGLRSYLLGPIAKALGGAMGGIGLPASFLPSFDGGGYTGSGARMGGLDGRGGYMALVHPNETVTDHTRRGAGGMAPQVVVNMQVKDAASFRAGRAQMAADLGRAVSFGARAR